MNNKWLTQCPSDDGITHVTLRVATTLLTAAQFQKQCNADKSGLPSRSLKLEPIKNFNFHIRPQHPKIGKDLLLSLF
jgi:hypothetical protein